MTDRASGEGVAGGDDRPAPPPRPASPTRPIRPTGATRPDQDPARIAAMFDRIAARYDVLNRLLSAGLDRRWRARAITALELTGRETVLDLCTGTADLALAAVRDRKRRAARVVGVDFASRMLHRGQAKLRQARVTEVRLIRGDALRIPLAAGSVDAVTIAFGIRNVSDPAAVCAEMSRVLRPGGQIAILEFGIPQLPGLRVLYLWYFRRVLPRIGRLISRHREAYTYLPASVTTFFSPEAFSDLLHQAGFSVSRPVPLAFGIVYLYVAAKS